MQERVSVGSRENFVFLSYPTSTSNNNDLIRDGKTKAASGNGGGNSSGNGAVSSNNSGRGATRAISGDVADKRRSPSTDTNKHDKDELQLERAIDAQVKRNFPGVVSSSFKIALVVYILCVVLSIVDVSSTSLSQMLVTLLALGLLFAFIRVINFKIESRNARKVSTD
eukprot:gene24244-30563_t